MTYPRRGLIASLIVVGILVPGCGSPGAEPASTADPQAVAERFADVQERAWNLDAEVALGEFTPLVCDLWAQEMWHEALRRGQLLSGGGRQQVDRIEVGATDVEVRGDRAGFTLTQRRGDGEATVVHMYELVRDGDTWRICGQGGQAQPPVPQPAR